MAKSQVDAYLNEFKGNLFEYLFAAELATQYNIQNEFILSLGSEFRHKLQQYELFIRDHDPKLLSLLRNYSIQAVEAYKKSINTKISNISLVGKIANSNKKNVYQEADLIVSMEEKDKDLISLKLGKYQSNINTKSAGIRTVIAKYFTNFQQAQNLQNTLNDVVDQAYQQMAYELHEIKGLVCDLKFKNWQENGFSILPGELESDCRDRLKVYYSKISNQLQKGLIELFKEDQEEFLASIKPLIGLSNNNLTQVVCFHSKKEDLDKVYIEKGKAIELKEFSSNLSTTSYFTIELAHLSFQMRIKPMNTFNNTSLKVNCSVKYKS